MYKRVAAHRHICKIKLKIWHEYEMYARSCTVSYRDAEGASSCPTGLVHFEAGCA